MTAPAPSHSAAHRPPRRAARVWAWVVYDLANTVYAATLTFLFTPFVADQGGREALGYTNFASMALAGCLVPMFGALADHTARTRRYLVVATLLCIAAMLGWSFDGSRAWLIGCFFVANLAYNTSLLFYNSLLPAVADDAHVGRVSGLGVGIGYFGTILVLAALLPLPAAPTTKFALAGGLFLVAALPCLLLVADPRPPRAGSSRGAIAAALQTLGATLKDLPRRRALLWFLIGNLCLVDVLNTAVLFFADFTLQVFADPLREHAVALFGHALEGQGLLLVTGLALNFLALPFGVLLGRFTDRAPLAVMRLSGLALFGALAGGALFGGTSLVGYLLTLVALGALGLAGIWTAGRKVVLILAPPERVGEYFGLYGITTKLSVFGSAIYAFVAEHVGTKPAMLAQGVQLAIGLGCLAVVRLPANGETGRPA